MIRYVLAVCSILFAGNCVHAADWFKHKDGEFDARVAVTIENPAQADHPGVAVSVTFVELRETLPMAARRNVAVADEQGEPVPSQSSAEWLTFVVPVKAKEKKTVYVYGSKERIPLPKFETKTGTDMREAWRSFENEFMGYRVEVGEKAKTTGLAIDLFGKTKDGRGAILDRIYASDYHALQPWGIDVMKVSHGPGLGGIYLFVGEKMGRTDAATTHFRVQYEGAVQTCVVAEGPVDIDGQKLKVTRVINVTAGDRTLDDTIIVEGPAEALEDLKIGVGLRDLPDQKWIEKTSEGYALVAGKGNQEGTQELGLGVVFDPKDYLRTHVLEHEADGGRYYLLTPHSDEGEEGSVHVHTRLMAYWDGDGWVNNVQQFESLVKHWAELHRNPPKITFASQAEMQ